LLKNIFLSDNWLIKVQLKSNKLEDCRLKLEKFIAKLHSAKIKLSLNWVKFNHRIN